MIGFGWGFLGSSLWLFLTFGLRVGLGVGVKGILRSWGFRISVVSNFWVSWVKGYDLRFLLHLNVIDLQIL
jgi:hypothetical protein